MQALIFLFILNLTSIYSIQAELKISLDTNKASCDTCKRSIIKCIVKNIVSNAPNFLSSIFKKLLYLPVRK